MHHALDVVTYPDELSVFRTDDVWVSREQCAAAGGAVSCWSRAVLPPGESR